MMPWYLWLLFGMWIGTIAGIFIIILCRMAKE